MLDEEHEIEIQDLAFGGEGVGKIGRLVCFIPNTVPGDRALVRIREQKKNFLRADLIEIKVPSSSRREPPCPYFDRCGGCQWQHIDYPVQLEAKRSHLQHILKKNGGIEYEVPPPVPSPEIYHYRRAVRFKLTSSGELGFFAKASHQLVPIDRCMVCEEELNTALQDVKAQIQRYRGRTGDLEIVSDDSRSVQWDFIPMGEKSKLGFSQANRRINSKLQDLVRRSLTDRIPEEGSVADLFCGDGNLSLPLADLGLKVKGYDISDASIRKARAEVSERRLRSFSYEKASLHKMLRLLEDQKGKYDAAICDPPRQGLAKLAGKMAALDIPLFLYISCFPAVLARDLQAFIARGYTIVSIQPLDMFPHTYHLETLVVLSLQGA